MHEYGIFFKYFSAFFSRIADECELSFTPMMSLPTGQNPIAVKTADFNNDRFLDLAVANHNGNTTTIFLGYGTGGFKKHVDLWNGPNAGTNGIAIGDVNKDNYLDIIVVNRHGSNVGVFLGHGDGNFSDQITFSTGNGSSPAGLALHDLNHDHILDLVVTDHVNGFLLVFFGKGNGTFTKVATLATGNDSGPYLVIVDDLNNDGHFDIIVGSGDGNHIDVFLGHGTDTFSEQKTYILEGGPYSLVAYDFDTDGILDIATANYDGNSTSVIFGNGDGTFSRRKTFSTGDGSLPYSIAMADFDGDDKLDLIVPNSGTDNMGILLGYGKGRFRSQETYSTGKDSSPRELAVGDFNGDNKMDFVSANYNQNTVGIFLNTCS